MPSVTADLDFAALWGQALPFSGFLATADRRTFWEGVYRQARPPAWATDEAARRAPQRWLVLAEDWCNDAVSVVPVLAKLAEAVPGIELRILRRDEHPEVMDAFLTDGARAIPIVMVLGDDGELIGVWGPRPAPLQEWVQRHRDLEAPVRVLEARKWYARDAGWTTMREVLAVGAAA